MKLHRRHESLIPLSREHHYGLLVCLRIHRGIENHQADVSWLNERAEKVVRFFESELKTHFKAEEEIVFPAMKGIEDSRATIDRVSRCTGARYRREYRDTSWGPAPTRL